MRSIRPLLTAVGVVSALTLTAACGGGGEDRASDGPTASGPAAGSSSPVPTQDRPVDAAPQESTRPSKEPSDGSGSSGVDEKEWREGGWRNWDRSTWRRDAGDFVNPVIDDHWKPERMSTAKPPKPVIKPTPDGKPTPDDKPPAEKPKDPKPPKGEDPKGEDPNGQGPDEPEVVEAQAEKVPYRQYAPTSGKVFFDAPEGAMVCSATVVQDPKNPGRSNLVWTAGHCVHAGKKGGWYRNVAFVPAYNDKGLPKRALADATAQEIAPFGTYWADWVATSNQWIKGGDPDDGSGAPFDFAVLHVRPEAGGKSLEETVGSAVAVDFDAPRPQDASSVTLWGYPAGWPYNGATMYKCTDRPGPFDFTPGAPVMWRAGCSMTGGSSGGGWIVQGADGAPALVSNTSIGPLDPIWLAGPSLGADAEKVFTGVSAKYAP
ncbi:trypsin-like serine peptidase [Streptomyces sp. NPDC003860]